MKINEYMELALDLYSNTRSEESRLRLIEYIKQKPIEAIDYTLAILENQENIHLLEIVTTTILETILKIPNQAAREYTSKYIKMYPNILKTLLNDIKILYQCNKLQELQQILKYEVMYLKPPIETHLKTQMLGQTIKQLLQQVIDQLPIAWALVDLGGAVFSVSWSPNGEYIVAGSLEVAIFLTCNINWNKICKNSNDELLSEGIGYICKGKWINGLATYLLLRDSGYGTIVLANGLVGFSSIRDIILFNSLSEKFREFYIDVLYSSVSSLTVLLISFSYF